MFTRILFFVPDLILAGLESLFSYVPHISHEEQAAREMENWKYEPASNYYFLGDKSPRRLQRWKAILKFDRKQISFWKSRQWWLRYYRQQVEHFTKLLETSSNPFERALFTAWLAHHQFPEDPALREQMRTAERENAPVTY